MKAPSIDDRIVKVRAYFSDEAFGYDHWRATQFLSPPESSPAVLVVCKTEAERDALFARLIGEKP
jgi:hypothetical protein